MTRAAEALAVSYPVVSKTISELEHTLGVKLFDRSISGVEPTHYGRALLKSGVAVFDETRKGLQQIEFIKQEFIAWLKANPDKASKGTSGVGSAIHVAGVFLQQETGTRFQFVPYRGGIPAMQDLVAGQIDFMIDLAANALPHVRAGNIKAYAVTDKKRLPSAPEIPTVDEAGMPGLHVSTWFGLWGTKGTPRAVVTKLNASLIEALADPAVRMRFADLGQEMFPREQQTPEALAAFHKAEIEKWWPIIKAAGIKAE
jgi:tripartite-type tricarboxylate transporter receptor subunit TctC